MVHKPVLKQQKVRKKTLSASSKDWVRRQMNDPYVIKARAEGYRARAAYKLLDIDERFGVLKAGQVVVDLGCAPGSWCQIAVKRGCPTVVGIDLLECAPMAGAEMIVGDFTTEEGLAAVQKAVGGKPVTLVLCDMAANTVGHKETDGIRTQALSELGVEYALKYLAPGGNFVTKLFMNGYEAEAKKIMSPYFTRAQLFKPESSRAESREIFLVCLGKKA